MEYKIYVLRYTKDKRVRILLEISMHSQVPNE